MTTTNDGNLEVPHSGIFVRFSFVQFCFLQIIHLTSKTAPFLLRTMAILEGILSMLGRLFLTSTILLVVLGLVLHWLVKKQQMPPGPLAIPYIGTPSVYLSLARGMTDLYNSHVPKTVERYGPIFTWYFGPV